MMITLRSCIFPLLLFIQQAGGEIFLFFFCVFVCFNRMQLIILIKPIDNQRNFSAILGLPLIVVPGNPPQEGSPRDWGGQGS